MLYKMFFFYNILILTFAVEPMLPSVAFVTFTVEGSCCVNTLMLTSSISQTTLIDFYKVIKIQILIIIHYVNVRQYEGLIEIDMLILHICQPSSNHL